MRFIRSSDTGIRGVQKHIRLLRIRFLVPVAIFAVLFSNPRVYGQEALRISLAGETTHEQQSRAAAAIGYYNLMTGPATWRFSSGLISEYDDNINLSEQNPDGDFIFRPNLETEMNWPISQNNVLNLALDAGYSLYVQHPELDNLYINASDLSLDIYIGNLTINLHDRLSITEDSFQNPTTTTTSTVNGNIVPLQNSAGATATWDLDKFVLEGDYDHVNYTVLSSSLPYPSGTSDNLVLSAGARVRDKIVMGIEGGGSLINYSQSGSITTPNATQWNAGAFCDAPISDYLSARLDMGYTVYSPEATAFTPAPGGASGFYFQFSVAHQVNQSISYTLQAGRSIDLAFYGQPYEYYFVQAQPNWNFFKNYILSTPFWWRQGTEVYNQSLTFDQFSGGISLTRTITQKMTGTISYQIVKENSNQANLSYLANIVSLSFSYQF
jgi:hypothetical protein